jgi:hypothetical protein
MAAAPWPASRDFVEAIQNPAISFVDPELKATTAATDRLGMPLVTSGQFAYVFKLNGANAGSAQAVRCFRGFLGDREQRYQAIDDHLDKVSIPSLASFEYDPQGITVSGRKYPVLVMEWIDGLPLDVYIAEVFQRADVLKFLADLWLKTVGSLRTANVAHGDLQHGNIIIQNGNVRLVDLDGMFVPAMAGWQAAELGHQHYQHPARTPLHFSAELDNFSALVIYISFLALAERPELWTEFHDENLIFTKKDFQAPGSSNLFSKLRKIGTIQPLIGALVKACNHDPLRCPYLLDLVAPTSKLPAWMRNAPDVQIKTTTREAQALSGTPPPVPSQYRREVVGPAASAASTPAWQPSTAASQPAPASVPPTISGQYPPTLQAPARQFLKALRYALNYAFINVWWAWIWFPVMRALFQGLGAAQDVAGVLSIGTFLSGCFWLGHRKAVAVSHPQPIRSSPPVVTVPASPSPIPVSPSYRTTSSRPTWHPSPASSRPATQPTARFVGNRVSMVFHEASCEWARKISFRNRTTFSSSSEARTRGYRPCRVCHP